MDTNILQQIKEQYDRNFPFVIYRKPRQKEIVLLLQTDDNCYKDDNLGQAGFAMAPFDNSLETVLIPLHKATLYRFPIDGTNEVKNKYSFKENKQEYRQDYIAKLQETIGAIRDGDLQKIVFSRKEVLNIESLDILQTFQNLVTAYPLAMVYCWYHPNYGVWLGATPETLFTYKQGYFATMALAGTRKLSKNRNTPWGIKELEEQKMVTDYIVKQLQKQQIKSTIGKL
ncbi:MAG: chorismate-binding protein, partial [Flavobacteriaceae bacterium]|nr:chorismate-binding protein [Flavobacteriaceae bacterium]